MHASTPRSLHRNFASLFCSILCLAREMLGESYENAVLELNASDARGIDVVRNKIKLFAKKKVTLPQGRHKIIILGEQIIIIYRLIFMLMHIIFCWFRALIESCILFMHFYVHFHLRVQTRPIR